MTFEKKKGVCKRDSLGTQEDHPSRRQVEESVIHACSQPCLPAAMVSRGVLGLGQSTVSSENMP